MKYILFGVALTSASLVTASPTSATQSASPKADWKYSHGGDGVTLPASAIGTSLTLNGSHLDVRFLVSQNNVLTHYHYHQL